MKILGLILAAIFWVAGEASSQPWRSRETTNAFEAFSFANTNHTSLFGRDFVPAWWEGEGNFELTGQHFHCPVDSVDLDLVHVRVIIRAKSVDGSAADFSRTVVIVFAAPENDNTLGHFKSDQALAFGQATFTDLGKDLYLVDLPLKTSIKKAGWYYYLAFDSGFSNGKRYHAEISRYKGRGIDNHFPPEFDADKAVASTTINSAGQISVVPDRRGMDFDVQLGCASGPLLCMAFTLDPKPDQNGNWPRPTFRIVRHPISLSEQDNVVSGNLYKVVWTYGYCVGWLYRMKSITQYDYAVPVQSHGHYWEIDPESLYLRLLNPNAPLTLGANFFQIGEPESIPVSVPNIQDYWPEYDSLFENAGCQI